jgi:hypothetical protein
MASNYYDKASLVMIPDAPLDGKLLSVKPQDRSGDFTFSRGSNLAATRVDANGLIEKGRENLFTYSNDFSNSSWLKADTSVTGGQAGYDGTNDAWLLEITGSTGFQTIRKQPISFSGVNTFSFYAKAGTLSWVRVNTSVASTYFDIGNGIVGSEDSSIGASIEAAGNGYYRCVVPVEGSSSVFYIYPASGNSNVSQSSGNIYIQDAQWEQSLVATDYIETGASTAQAGILEDMPRLDYTDSSCPALLLEPQRSNSHIHSEYLADSYWLKYQCSITSNQAISPDGTNNASLFTATATGTNVIYRVGVSYGALSFFAKADNLSAGARFHIAVDTIGSANWNQDGTLYNQSGGLVSATDGEYYGNGWYRFTYVVGSGSVQNFGLSNSTSGDTAYIWGVQSEPNASYPTSYIPTYGSSVTRVVETCLLNNSSALPTSYPFTLYTESIIKSIGSEFLMSFLNASDNVSYASMYLSSGIPTLNARSGSSDVAVASPNSVSEGSVKIVGVFESSTLKLFVNGALKASISNTTTFQSGWNDLLIGQLRTITDTGNRTTNRQALVFPTALTDQEAIDLTTI